MFLAEKNIYFQVFKIQKLGPYFFFINKGYQKQL
jgi:hypothetical protein